MKTTWSIVLGTLLYANVAHGAILYLNWEDTSDATLALGSGETTRLVSSVELFAGESLVGFGYANTEMEGDPVVQVDFETAPPGWVNLEPEDNRAFGRPWQGVAGYTPGNTNALLGPGTFILAYQTIQLVDASQTEDLSITYKMTEPAGGSWHFAPALIDASGNDLAWNSDYATNPGFVMFGEFGNPGWENQGGSGQPAASPLILRPQVPEPASVVLLALGGLMLTRRRRA